MSNLPSTERDLKDYQRDPERGLYLPGGFSGGTPTTVDNSATAVAALLQGNVGTPAITITAGDGNGHIIGNNSGTIIFQNGAGEDAPPVGEEVTHDRTTETTVAGTDEEVAQDTEPTNEEEEQQRTVIMQFLRDHGYLGIIGLLGLFAYFGLKGDNDNSGLPGRVDGIEERISGIDSNAGDIQSLLEQFADLERKVQANGAGILDNATAIEDIVNGNLPLVSEELGPDGKTITKHLGAYPGDPETDRAVAVTAARLERRFHKCASPADYEQFLQMLISPTQYFSTDRTLISWDITINGQTYQSGSTATFLAGGAGVQLDGETYNLNDVISNFEVNQDTGSLSFSVVDANGDAHDATCNIVIRPK